MKRIRFDKPNVILDENAIPSEVENFELVGKGIEGDPVPHLDKEYSFSVELSEGESKRLSKMLFLNRIEWLTKQMNTVWKSKFYIK